METEAKYCTRCGDEIPAGRLKAMPDTLVCVKCSEEIGGEFELKVTISGTAKAGSLKVTGQEVAVERKRKSLRPKADARQINKYVELPSLSDEVPSRPDGAAKPDK